jgi:hypothetical protein
LVYHYLMCSSSPVHLPGVFNMFVCHISLWLDVCWVPVWIYCFAFVVKFDRCFLRHMYKGGWNLFLSIVSAKWVPVSSCTTVLYCKYICQLITGKHSLLPVVVNGYMFMVVVFQPSLSSLVAVSWLLYIMCLERLYVSCHSRVSYQSIVLAEQCGCLRGLLISPSNVGEWNYEK